MIMEYVSKIAQKQNNVTPLTTSYTVIWYYRYIIQIAFNKVNMFDNSFELKNNVM